MNVIAIDVIACRQSRTFLRKHVSMCPFVQCLFRIDFTSLLVLFHIIIHISQYVILYLRFVYTNFKTTEPNMDDLPQTQTQEDYIDYLQEIQITPPWGRLCACLSTLTSVDLVEPTYTFGRAYNCNIRINESQFTSILNVSKEHFKICQDDDVVYIIDLSKNGTFVNDIKVGKNNKHIIYNDDVIAIGHPKSKIYTFSHNMNREDDDYPREMRLKYFISKKLGRGAFGEVRLTYDKKTFKKFAVKRIDKVRTSSSIAGYANPPEKVKTEIEILSSFSYAFIIQMLEVFETDRDVFLVLEYMQGGELNCRILSAVPFPEAEVKYIFYQILLAVRYLHVNGVTHRDLKPENVLLISNTVYPMIKVSDFGLSKIMDETSKMETICGTISYTAPEVLNCYERYDKKVDIWSLGVILFYMLNKTLPFTGSDKTDVARSILSGKIDWDCRSWKGISTSAKNLTRRMLIVNPELRISVPEIFKQDWLAKDVNVRHRVEQLLTPTFEETSTSEETIAPLPKRIRLTGNDHVSV